MMVTRMATTWSPVVQHGHQQGAGSPTWTTPCLVAGFLAGQDLVVHPAVLASAAVLLHLMAILGGAAELEVDELASPHSAQGMIRTRTPVLGVKASKRPVSDWCAPRVWSRGPGRG